MQTTRKQSIMLTILVSIGIVALGRWWRVSDAKIVSPPPASVANVPSITGTMLISPYDVWDQLRAVLITTKQQLLVRQYALSYDKAYTLLKNLAYLGVNIQIIHERLPYGQDDKWFQKMRKALASSGISVFPDDQIGITYQHAKVRVGDDDFYVISSANTTYPSFVNNREYRFIGHQPAIISWLQHIFAADVAWERVSPDDIPAPLLVCPIDCRKKIMDALAQAQQSIAIEAQYLEDPAIIALLADLSRHVTIRIIVGDNQKREGIGDLQPYMKILVEPYVHAKELLIDGTILIHGSMNLSANALDANREIGILINDPAVIKQFMRQFEQDWQKAEEI